MMKRQSISMMKFGVVAAAVSLFSPNVHIETVGTQAGQGVAPSLSISLFSVAEARGRGGGGGGHMGGGGMGRGGMGGNMGGGGMSRGNMGSGRINRENIGDGNDRYYGGYGGYYGGYYGGAYGGGYVGGYGSGDNSNSMSVSAVPYAKDLAVGSIIIAYTMPPTCSSILAGTNHYLECDKLYYKPFYNGDTLVYEAVGSTFQ